MLSAITKCFLKSRLDAWERQIADGTERGDVEWWEALVLDAIFSLSSSGLGRNCFR